MARILICEPHPDIRALFAFVVRRGGNEPVASDGTGEQAGDVDAIVLEPGDETAVRVGAWAREHAPSVPLVCASIFPPGPESATLRPEAYLVKPFPLHELEQALAEALARRLRVA